MVELDNANITVKRQAELLSVNRTSVYRPTKEQRESEENVRLMHRIDEIYMKHPYLLRGLTIDRPNQVWGIDITYLRMGKGFMYLFLIIDWYSRKVIDYELSSTLEKGFILKCLKRAFSRCKPEIMNSDQGSHFTNSDYLELLEKEGIKVSMDGKGRATDNSRTERFFRSLKYECIYINEFEDPRALRQGIARYVQFYNEERPHQSLGEARPVQFYDHNVNQIAS